MSLLTFIFVIYVTLHINIIVVPSKINDPKINKPYLSRTDYWSSLGAGENIRGTQEAVLSLLFLKSNVCILFRFFILPAINENYLPNLMDTRIKTLPDSTIKIYFKKAFV